MNHPPRPALVERTVYEPAGPQEEFMVPLLRERIERHLEELARERPRGARALDIGCGGQPFRKVLEDHGFVYTGMDVQSNTEPKVDVVAAIEDPLPEELLALGPYQFLLCTEVLEHVADWHAAFNNFSRLMAPGSKLLVTCPQFYPLHEEPYDFWRPTLHALTYHSKLAGLRTLSLEAAGDTWDVLGTLLATCWPTPLNLRLQDQVLTSLTGLGRRLLLRLLLTRRLQRAVRLNGPLYLSNIAVFERA